MKFAVQSSRFPVDLERLGRDLSQEEEIVRAITGSLVAKRFVESPYKSGRSDYAWHPACYQSMRIPDPSRTSVTIVVHAGRTIREVRVNMQGYRNRLPPEASFAHEWDSVLVSDGSIEMRAGALGVSLQGRMDAKVRVKLCEAIYRAAMEHPIARARIEVASPAMSAGLLERYQGDGHLDFRTTKEAVAKMVVSKALEVTGYWNPRTRPLFYVGIFAVPSFFIWCGVKLWSCATAWGTRLRSRLRPPVAPSA